MKIDLRYIIIPVALFAPLVLMLLWRFIFYGFDPMGDEAKAFLATLSFAWGVIFAFTAAMDGPIWFHIGRKDK